MTDLEIIKKELNQIPDGYESVNQCKATYEILKAAERMAAEINNWKDVFKTKVVDNEELEKGFNNAIVEIVNLNDEIDRLKAELASRPEVVFCKDCVHPNNRCPKKIYFPYDAGCTTTEYQKIEISFCSFGVKKENEREGKK